MCKEKLATAPVIYSREINLDIDIDTDCLIRFGGHNKQAEKKKKATTKTHQRLLVVLLLPPPKTKARIQITTLSTITITTWRTIIMTIT